MDLSDTGSCLDRVLISSLPEREILIEYCGNDTGGLEVDNKMLEVRFETDDDLVATGFEITFGELLIPYCNYDAYYSYSNSISKTFNALPDHKTHARTTDNLFLEFVVPFVSFRRWIPLICNHTSIYLQSRIVHASSTHCKPTGLYNPSTGLSTRRTVEIVRLK